MAGGGGMQGLAELERRISEALSRIDYGLTKLPAAGTAASGADEAEVMSLRAELAAERQARAALQAQLEARPPGGDAAQVARLTQLLDAQGQDLMRLRKTVATLRDSLQALRGAQAAAMPEAINRAMQAELQAMQAERQSEMTELDGLIAALDPLLPATAEEGRDNA